jgi:hypothetical protein
MSDLVRFSLSTKEMGPLHFARVLPRGEDIWGFLSSIQDTSWVELVTIIDSDDLQNAILGYTYEFIHGLGNPLKVRLKRLKDDESRCLLAQNKECPNKRNICCPGFDMPECYEPPLKDKDKNNAALQLSLVIKEDRYILVVKSHKGRI